MDEHDVGGTPVSNDSTQPTASPVQPAQQPGSPVAPGQYTAPGQTPNHNSQNGFNQNFNPGYNPGGFGVPQYRTAPGAAQYNQPNAPHYNQPNTPHYNQPNTPHYNQPNTPHYNQPNTPHYNQPNTPNYNQPNTPPYRPSDIYRNRQQNAPFGGAPQYHYGTPINMMNPQYYQEQQERNKRRRIHQKEIKKVSAIIAVGLMFSLIIGLLLSLIMRATGTLSLYDSNFLFQTAVAILYSVCAFAIPFTVIKKVLNKQGLSRPIPFNRPKNGLKSLLLIFAGLGGCLAANYVVNIIAGIFEQFGFFFNSSKMADPKNIYDIIIMFVATAIVPPLVEEYALRGVIMQTLRRYGDGFAIVITALLFGFMHGDPLQIPFAFLCALFIGYAVIATESLWTGVIIHLLMNCFSCVYSTLLLYTSDEAANNIVVAAEIAFIVIGIAAAVFYYLLYAQKRRELAPSQNTDMTSGERAKKFIFTPVMIFAFIIFIFEALSAITTQSGIYR